MVWRVWCIKWQGKFSYRVASQSERVHPYIAIVAGHASRAREIGWLDWILRGSRNRRVFSSSLQFGIRQTGVNSRMLFQQTTAEKWSGARQKAPN